MKISYIKTLSVGLVLMLFILTSCEDFLTQESRISPTEELVLSTYAGLVQATVGAYSPLYSSSWYGRDFVITADLKGGNAKLSPKSSGRFTLESAWSNTPSNTINTWTSAYATIARANNVINALNGFSEPGITQDSLDNLKGECLFLRALAHFDLVRFYAQPYSAGTNNMGVPVVLVTEMGKPARNTVGEVYDQILADLLEAEEIIKDDQSQIHVTDNADARAWATKDAVRALLARVYLYMEDWQNAADYATMLINSPDYELYDATTYTTWDNDGVWGTDAASEIIFEVYGSIGNASHGNWDVISYILSPDGYGDIGVSNDLQSLYEDGDIRKELVQTSESFPGGLWTLKYPGKAGNIREDNIPVLRLGEMYLIRAEALLNGATVLGATALGDYNDLREPLGLDAAITVTLSDIYEERRRELCFEGHELFDLARTQRGLSRTDYDGTVNKDVPFPDNKWAMPIIQAEIDANENIVQNPN